MAGIVKKHWCIPLLHFKVETGNCFTLKSQKLMKIFLFYTFLFFTASTTGQAQPGSASSDSAIVGTWKGNSICQVKNSPCHDEIVVYLISKGKGIDSFNVRASKIVNSAEVNMGTMSCLLDRKRNQLKSSEGSNILTLDIKGKTIDGTLIFNGSLYRIIKLLKQD
jgi:hypothetical protein